MKHTNAKSSQSETSANPTTLNLQTRPFAPIQADSDQDDKVTDGVSNQSRVPSSQNILARLIATPKTEPSATPIRRKVFPSMRMPIQAKLSIGEQNEMADRESFSDEHASSENLLAKIISTPPSQPSPTPIRRKVFPSMRMPIQAKLNIGEPNDKYEKEADNTAAKVVEQINSSSQDNSVQKQETEDEELQMKPISTIQREKGMEGEELQMQSLVQRQENLGGGEASEDLESSIQSARGSGQSLDTKLQAKMGEAMGADFSGVKVHTDSQSDRLNKSIQAKAFTTGQDVFFRQGAYEPSSRGGQELIAHELTHVVQQTGAVRQNNIAQRFVEGYTSGKFNKGKKNTDRVVKHHTIQRDLTGEDPLENYDEGDKSLFYGINPYRVKTLGRRDNEQKKNKYHTIDLYNKAIGINTVMTTSNCIYGIFLVREALSDANPAANWGNYFPAAAQEVNDNPELQRWIEKLAQNSHNIGLNDVSDSTKVGVYGFRQRRGKKKLKKKDRLTKNIDPSGGMMSHQGSVKADDVYGWLANNYTYSQAKAITPVLAGMPDKKFYAIDQWIYLAFFRRTSKLGIDFATSSAANGGLDANINFNNAAVVGYVKGVKENPQADGIATGNVADQQKHKRAITTSEHRHINKLINTGKLNPNKVKNYNEF